MSSRLTSCNDPSIALWEYIDPAGAEANFDPRGFFCRFFDNNDDLSAKETLERLPDVAIQYLVWVTAHALVVLCKRSAASLEACIKLQRTEASGRYLQSPDLLRHYQSVQRLIVERLLAGSDSKLEDLDRMAVVDILTESHRPDELLRCLVDHVFDAIHAGTAVAFDPSDFFGDMCSELMLELSSTSCYGACSLQIELEVHHLIFGGLKPGESISREAAEWSVEFARSIQDPSL